MFFSQFRAIGPDDRPNYKNWNISCNMYSRYFKTSPSQMTLFAPFFSVQTTHMYFYVVGMYDDIYS